MCHQIFSICALVLGGFLLPATLPAQVEKVWADTLLAQKLLDDAGKHFRKEEHHTSLLKAEQAAAIYARLYGPDHVQTALAQMYVARQLRELEQIPASVGLFRQSLRIFEAARDTINLARCLNNLSLSLGKQQQLAAAKQYLQQAIELLRHHRSAPAVLLAGFHVNLANLLVVEKNYLDAMPLLESAKATYTLPPQDPRYLGFTDYHLGNAYYGLHDYIRAKEHYLLALANLQKAETPPDHSFFADLKVKIGLCYQKTGEAEAGLSWLLEAQTVYLKAGETDPNHIAFLQELGQFYLDEKQFGAAVAQLGACLRARENRYGPQSPRLLNTLRLLGEAGLAAGGYADSEGCFRRALRIAADSLRGDYHLRFRFYGKLAELRFLKGDLLGSRALCDTAFAVAHFDKKHPENTLPRDFFRDLCRQYAKTLLGLYHKSADTALLYRAERYLDIAAETLHRELTEISVNSSREVFYDLDHPLLEEWLDVRMLLYERTHDPAHAEMAFQIAGQSKAFLLSEAMRRSGLLRYAGVPDSILQAELALQGHILEAEKKLANRSLQSSAQIDSMVLKTNHELANWRSQYAALLRRIGAQYPNYFRLRFLRNDVPIRELQQRWLAPDQTLLLYSFSEANLYIFVVNRDTFCALKRPLEVVLKEDLSRFRECLTGYFVAPNPDDALYDHHLEAYVALAQALYQQLIAPVAPLLSGRVLLIPEGALCYLPFEALLTAAPTETANFRTYPFWFREKALSYGLSTHYIVETAAVPTHKPTKNWLGLAPFAKMSGPTGPFLALPESGKEVQDIAALLKGECWLGPAARLGRFQAEAPHYQCLHLATHSYADDHRGNDSYLAVSNTDTPLYAKDLYQFRLAAELVVLSACEAGGGKLLRGEGIIGLVRAFTYAGAKSIVASLWVANDQSTAKLMLAFYRALQQGQPKDIALQKARTRLLDWEGAEAHPFFWAGFRAYGNVGALNLAKKAAVPTKNGGIK